MNGSNEAATAADDRARTISKLEAGSRIAREKWDSRPAGIGERAAKALDWSRVARTAFADKAATSPLAQLAAIAGGAGLGSVVEALLARVLLELRFLLAVLDPATTMRGYAPERGEMFDLLLAISRTTEAAAGAASADRDATILALHAAANGRAPWLGEDPDVHDPPSSPFVTIGRELRFNAWECEDAGSVCRALGKGDGRELERGEVEAILRFTAKHRERFEAIVDDERDASVPPLRAVLAAHPGRWEPEAVQAAESFAARLGSDRSPAWWETQLDRFDEAAKSARGEAPVIASPRGSDDDDGPGGPPTPPSSASPAAPPAAPQGSATMPPPTLGSPPWRGAAPVPRPRRGAPHLRLVTARPEPEVELVREAIGGGR